MNRRWRLLVGSLLLAAMVLPPPAVAVSHPGPQSITPISVGLSGQGGGSYAAISGDGRYVAFESPASDLAPNHIADSWDVFIRDRQTQKVEMASTRSGGAAVYNPGDYTASPAISSSGQFVAFMSSASDLVAGDHNGFPDIFLHDRAANTTELVSLAPGGGSGNGPSFTPAVSADGRFVAFQSFADDLVAGDHNGALDVFVRDRKLGLTELVSVGDGGQQGADPADYGYPGLAISDDGRYVAFTYRNLPVSGSPGQGQDAVYLRDRQARTTQFVAAGRFPALSGSGRYLAYVAAGEDPGADVFLLDRQSGETVQVSVPRPGAGGGSRGEIFSPPSVSADGSLVAFETSAALDPGDNNGLTDIYLRDLGLQETVLVSAGPRGAGDGESHNPAVAANGSAVAFDSMAGDLVPGGETGKNQVYVYERSALNTLPAHTRVYIPIVQH